VRNVSTSPLLILKSVLFLLSCVNSSYLWNINAIGYLAYKISQMPLYSVDCYLGCVKPFKSDVVPLSFLFLVTVLLRSYPIILLSVRKFQSFLKLCDRNQVVKKRYIK
jgi:hypothetical protein